MVRKPKLLILDEATSALDSESEDFIQKAINGLKNKITIIIIAHRLSTIKDANLIVVMINGRVEEVGNHSKLIEFSGIYNNFVNLLTDEEVEIFWIEENTNIADAIFTYDASMMTKSGAILMLPGKELRKGEQNIHRNLKIEVRSRLHFFSVAAGSPGPLDKKIPSGSSFLISSISEFSDNTSTLALRLSLIHI